MSFAGLRVLSLESRRAREMEALIRREEGEPFVAPSVQEKAIEGQGAVLDFVERLEAGEFDMVICMTGVGLAFLRDVAASHMPVERLANGLQRVTILSRGPKPLPVLREMNLRAQIVVPEPNTWREIVDAVASRPERCIAVQEYGRPNLQLNQALEGLGARVTPVSIYRWELPADLGPLREAARDLAAGRYDVVLFTSAIQLDHLWEVAAGLGLETEVRKTLAERAAVASVGPVMTAALEARELTADIVPKHPKMGALVKAASESVAGVLARKRSEARPATEPG